jgi:Tol biopolymer transport system component
VSVGEGSNRDIQVYDLQRETWTKLTFGDGTYVHPIWSPDGNYIVFGSTGRGIFWTRADGGQPQSLTSGPAAQYASSFSPDGKTLAFYESGSALAQIWTVRLEEQGGTLKAGKPEQFLKSHTPGVRPTLLLGGPAAVDQHVGSGDEAGVVRA